MRQFWHNIIESIIKALKPSVILEIGVDKGDNTKNILNYCSTNNCKLISIDPYPHESIVEFEYEYEDIFTLIRDLSLNVLPDISKAEIVLIDGDHNWYTVFNELKVLEEKATDSFPLIFLHDVEWPYDHRDMYYDPDNIPSEYIQPYEKKGINLHSKKLSDTYGVNSGLYNAVESGTDQNGVLTAVEDFIRQSSFDLNFMKIPGFHGLGIIYDTNLYNENYEFKIIIDKFNASLDDLGRYLRKLSYSNYENLNKFSYYAEENADLRNSYYTELQEIRNEKLNLEILHGNSIHQLNVLENNNKNLETELMNKNNSLTILESELQNNSIKISDLESELEIKDNNIFVLESELQNKDNNVFALESELQDKDKKISALGLELQRKNNRLSDFRSRITALANSRKTDTNKNFQVLFPNYSSSSKSQMSFSSRLSNIPYLYMIFKSKGNLKKLRNTIKGYRAIKRLNLFDEVYYLNNYLDVLASGMNPLIHYLYFGWREGKNPSNEFDGNRYLQKYSDVKTSNTNPLLHYSLYGRNENRKKDLKISVVVTSFNHENYIKKCMDSILIQKGDFKLELIVGDDCSQDNTRKILEQYQKQHPSIINLLPKTKNMGVSKNLKRCMEAVTGEYVAVCEGDDCWIDPLKLQKQIKFLEKRKDCAFCFNSIFMYHENKKDKNYIFQKDLTKDTYTTRELILDNFIGNFSSCMYRTDIVKKLPNELYDLFTVDWMFNIACSEHGSIGFINEPMTLYRIHDKGLWSGKNRTLQYSELSKHIDSYNKFLKFKYNSEFNKYKKRLAQLKVDDKPVLKSGIQDLIILDDAFPHPLSAFRLQEFNSYLEYFDKSKVYCKSEIAFPCFNEDRPLKTIIEEYESIYPQCTGKVEKYNPNIELQSKLIYTIFLANIHLFIDMVEKYGIPFVFTLYPGGGFELNDENSDNKLKRVFSSPYFRKVIVTQRVTKEYLLENNFCKEEQIEDIFGVVTPLILLNKEYETKQYYGRDKDTFDICFVAYKYTEKGEDKGYDVFVDVAHELSKMYDNINFHVVGSFDENVLDVTQIQDRITFYGPKTSEWFDEFYKDKDIILSPNIPFKMFEGHFDGFPTGCCTDAGLHKVAIFCTDELNLNTKFNDDEIVIIPPDSEKIIEKIEEYYENPEKLREISEKGYLKIKELYNFENQIEPRIKILEQVISESNDKYINQADTKISCSTKEPVIHGDLDKYMDKLVLKLDNETFKVIPDSNNMNKYYFDFVVPINYVDGKQHQIQLIDETTDEIIFEKDLIWDPKYNLNQEINNRIENCLKEEEIKLTNSEIKLSNLQEEKRKLATLSTYKNLEEDVSLKLNIGCGSVKLPEWVNIDIEPDADLVIDVTNGLPFKDSSVDYIYNEHFIEHLKFDIGERSVKEFARVLKPGGVLRIATPDLDYIIGKYVGDWKDQDWLTWPGFEFIKTKGQMMNISMREWGHEYLYNEEDLRNLLKKVGFKNITKKELYVSDYKELSDLETRKDSKLILEAEKE